MESTVERILNAIIKAREKAAVMAEQFPEHGAALLRFAQEASRAQRELIANIQPDLAGTNDSVEERLKGWDTGNGDDL
ncbi:MAG TPA: hypothetical protein VL261_01790 [Nitrospira sp.]|jgi:hypothetical protein|nr:hypothetical protein [Nitrospira sp.]